MNNMLLDATFVILLFVIVRCAEIVIGTPPHDTRLRVFCYALVGILALIVVVAILRLTFF